MLSLRDKIHPARGLEADATLGAWLRSGEAEDTGWKRISANLIKGLGWDVFCPGGTA